MPNLLTRKDIANLIGKTPQYVGVQITRGKLIEKDKRIDTDNAKNKAFLAKFTSRQANEDEETQEANENNFNPDLTLTDRELLKGINRSNVDYYKDLKDVELKMVRISKERLELDKKKGKLIELKAATEVMQRSVVVLGSQYRQESKTFITELASKYNIPDEDLAGIQKKFDITINKAVNESKELIKSECEIIASEYSDSLNVGERK